MAPQSSRRCIVKNCNVRYKKGVVLYSFGQPGSFRRVNWLKALNFPPSQEISASWCICPVSILDYATILGHKRIGADHNIT